MNWPLLTLTHTSGMGMLNAQCSIISIALLAGMLNAQCSMLNAQCSMLDAKCSVFPFSQACACVKRDLSIRDLSVRDLSVRDLSVRDLSIR